MEGFGLVLEVVKLAAEEPVWLLEVESGRRSRQMAWVGICILPLEWPGHPRMHPAHAWVYRTPGVKYMTPAKTPTVSHFWDLADELRRVRGGPNLLRISFGERL